MDLTRATNRLYNQLSKHSDHVYFDSSSNFQCDLFNEKQSNDSDVVSPLIKNDTWEQPLFSRQRSTSMSESWYPILPPLPFKRESIWKMPVQISSKRKRLRDDSLTLWKRGHGDIVNGETYSPNTTGIKHSQLKIPLYANKHSHVLLLKSELIAVLELESIASTRGGLDICHSSAIQLDNKWSAISCILTRNNSGMPELDKCTLNVLPQDGNNGISGEPIEDVQHVLVHYRKQPISIPISRISVSSYIQLSPWSDTRMNGVYHLFSVGHNLIEQQLFFRNVTAHLDVLDFGMLRKLGSAAIEPNRFQNMNKDELFSIVDTTLRDNSHDYHDVVLFFVVPAPINLCTIAKLTGMFNLIMESQGQKKNGQRITMQIVPSNLLQHAIKYPIYDAICRSVFTKLAIAQATKEDGTDYRHSAALLSDNQSMNMHVAIMRHNSGIVVGWTDSCGQLLEAAYHPLSDPALERELQKNIWKKTIELANRMESCTHIVLSMLCHTITNFAEWQNPQCNIPYSIYNVEFYQVQLKEEVDLSTHKYQLRSDLDYGIIVGKSPFDNDARALPVLRFKKILGELSSGDVVQDFRALAVLKPVQDSLNIVPLHMELVVRLANYIIQLTM